ncbi:chemotaxis protein CheB [Daejeonella oryzae]|uniref:chemotaxis protein CheB n=1 Tax=Daejeonella oryzae TaxID=1122943 RepID=UPI0003F58963|nr:chemotaxis protein CheB [Daejeonella oryzae]
MAQDILNKKATEVLIIGGSAGSLEVILHALPLLSNPLKIAIIIVLHRKSSSESILTELLCIKTSIPVKEADEKEFIKSGTIYLAPADYHLLIEKDRTFSLDYSEKINFSRPCIDLTFQTAAEVYRESLAALLLSGANADGVEGLELIQLTGGLTAVQNPEDAKISYMPQHALDKLKPDLILNKDEVADFINRLH